MSRESIELDARIFDYEEPGLIFTEQNESISHPYLINMFSQFRIIEATLEN